MLQTTPSLTDVAAVADLQAPYALVGHGPQAGNRLMNLSAAAARPDADPEAAEVLRGLQAAPRRVSPRYFYDDRGSQLFEDICRQPEYYLTRTETLILDQQAVAIARLFGPGVLLLEPGSGSGEKTRLLLSALDRPAGYVPIDVCAAQLAASTAQLAASHPGLPVYPVCGDFTTSLKLPTFPAHNRRVLFFPGSTIGNFSPDEAVRLMRGFSKLVGAGGLIVAGVDLVKPVQLLERAYDDTAGVTARFNLNLLDHLNARFATDFDPTLFRHAAAWCEAHARIEMQLWPRRNHIVHFGDVPLYFAVGEKLVTEWSHKYTLGGFARLAGEAGLTQAQVWTDPRGWFSVQCLEVARQATG